MDMLSMVMCVCLCVRVFICSMYVCVYMCLCMDARALLEPKDSIHCITNTDSPRSKQNCLFVLLNRNVLVNPAGLL